MAVYGANWVERNTVDNDPRASGDSMTGDQGAETSAHTPGSWHSTEQDNALDIGHVSSSRDGFGDIATTWNDNAKANARLIAAAPDMLAALKDVDALWSNDALNFAEEMNLASPVGIVWAKVRAAIAKADGK